MRTFWNWLAVVAVAGLVAVAAGVRADEKADKIEPGKLPQKIKDAINARFPGAEITSAEKEKSGDKVIFDIELKHKGRKYEMDIQEDGTILEIEKEVAAKDVPAAIRKAIEDKYPKAKIIEVMEVNKVTGKDEKPIHYEVTFESNGKKQEVIVSLDGKSIKTEGEK